MVQTIETPLSQAAAIELKSGDRVLISGYVFTARDAAHRKLLETMEAGGELPISLTDAILYYVGPTPGFDTHAVGSAGPTTASRMDAYASKLYAMGLRGTIGKGNRSEIVQQAIVRHKAVYFAALGGIGALLSRCIQEAEVVAYPELGTEAVYRLKLHQFPAIVIYDSHGHDFYSSVREMQR